jgi:hypothetical protein
MTPFLSTAYLPSVNYFALLSQSEIALLERFEHYPKQTFRNRCTVYGANGPLSLTVPVTKGNLIKIYTKDIRIDYSTGWIKIHCKGIESAYNSSPFYQFYIDEIVDIFNKKHAFLYDLNLELIHLINDFAGIRTIVSGTNDYQPLAPEGFKDYRYLTNPKIKDASGFTFHFPQYTQVFDTKFGFIENLSIIDLLFNLGPDTGPYLKQVTIIGD